MIPRMLSGPCDTKFCTRCGCCISICPQECITITTHAEIDDSCTQCGLCREVCPGEGTDLKEEGRKLFEGSCYNQYVGWINHAYTGYSFSDAVRKRGTSGGVVTSLLICLLEKGMIDGALVVGFDPEKPWKTVYQVATCAEDILESAQTKYQVTPLTQRIFSLPLERIAVVGLPCVIQGLRKVQALKQGEKIRLLIGLFCWVNMEREATEFLLDMLKVSPEEVASLEYRGGDYLGGFRVTKKDGEVITLDKECYNVLPFLFAPERCVCCSDFTNELADISMGDAKFMHSQKGHTFVITRSQEGETMLKACLDHVSIDEHDIEDIIWSESSSLFFKKRGHRRLLREPSVHSEEEIDIPVKNRLFEFGFTLIHKNRNFFRSLFKAMPVELFKLVSRVITRERS
ncbi:MAG: Coenzyme F420 hydrogenase/dehydrogenase, beta subunit C-terminal domain [Theionarchaea archaeon]|nr:Coenzyme F420 hydrogenase/dehydrogenase, beta subunit C-terminal domain [Theionarchaea archaeon]MBU6999815.1 Coenzyme F420 hydrogenase/dehydrogenase, beta subunit C-terminal domain [Theionarchaea archaeon]MBU7020235.1 Coenzyme F420 hydrogenase/dehydrogenase, beta subunit C-terminal domain [Theionarchaea archaeon]MBU7040085.1 Coenzyme F420 hydrogenase/dehydrogenase, beta subunit C-terminal domain [Theionarchaea archaeon]